jgi:hypothetical protein
MAKSKKLAIPTSNNSVLKKRKLTLKQELFCQLYATDREFFGNGTQSYAEAYGIKLNKLNYSSVQRSASDNLLKPLIFDRINELLDKSGFNSVNVDKQHLFLINQHQDLKTKMAAIKEYNALKSRVVDKSTQNTFNQFNVMIPADKVDEFNEKVHNLIVSEVKKKHGRS